jgi:transposase
MTTIINHKNSHLIWAKKGHGKEILTSFFEELTVEQRAKIRYVTADGARWITDCVRDFCPNAQRCVDPFHVVGWATGCLDEVRRGVVRAVRKDVVEGKKDVVKKRCRCGGW